MVSNHIVMPIALRFLAARASGGGRRPPAAAHSRRVSIALILGLGFVYSASAAVATALAPSGSSPSPASRSSCRPDRRRSSGAAPRATGALRWASSPASWSGPARSSCLVSPAHADRPDASPKAPGASRRCGRRRCSALDGLDPLVHALFWSLGAQHPALRRRLALQRGAPARAPPGRAVRRRFRAGGDTPSLRRRLRGGRGSLQPRPAHPRCPPGARPLPREAARRTAPATSPSRPTRSSPGSSASSRARSAPPPPTRWWAGSSAAPSSA